MIQPVNGHLLIEPVKHEEFISSQRETFEEKGIVLAYAEGTNDVVSIGDTVLFDSWLCAKYPKNETEFYWLVKWEDVRAIEHAEIPE